VVSDLLGAIIRHVANHDAATTGRFQIDVIEADAAADDAAALRQRRDGVLGQLDVVEHQQHVGGRGARGHVRLVVGLQ